ncbi:DUF3973 domain-containing protein [Paenibacillus hamazuiensis]|uniref:DUF3973 domain-containing protein n=1 Tax=Paenibacillus hamazuiensis TaxID=2936508 RepID=UPI0020106A83|nr:DUF3973 domain-containing protein [Paenibacillus hamazuiensis]
MYYCLFCKTTHPKGAAGEIVFKTGFHFVQSVRYSAGLCKAALPTNANMAG